MEKIASIGLDLKTDEIKYIPLITASNISLSDYDIVLLEPSVLKNCGVIYTEKHSAYYFDPCNISSVIHSAAHWKEELTNFLLNGGVLIVNLCEVEEYQSIILNTTNNYSHFFPFDKGFINLSGSNIINKDPSFKDLFRSLKDKISYKVYLKNISSRDKVIFSNRTNDKALGIIENIGSNGGYIIYLPYIDFTPEDDDSIKRFIQCIIAIKKKNKEIEEKTPNPLWLGTSDRYLIQSAESLKKDVKCNEEAIENLKQKITELEEEIKEQELLKDLLFEQGKTLEKAVIKAFELLGYNAEEYDDGELQLDQVIISPEGYRFIGECEGKDNKDIDISKFRQLSESLNADLEKEDVKEKAYGLLIGNPQRLLNPKDRTLTFTQKCIIGAKRDKIGLIKTVDLFDVAKYIQESNDIEFAKRCRDAIFNQLGEIIKFPDIPV